MRRTLVVLLLTLAACAAGVAKTIGVSSNPRAWELPTGRRPSRVEYAALLAACRDKAQSSAGLKIDACLSGDYGMRRAP